MDIQTLTLYRKEVLLNLSTAKNLVKSVLTEVGIRIGEVVKDLNGPTYRKMVWGFINGATPEEALQLAGNSFKGDRAQALEALSGDLSPIRRTTLKEMVQNIERFEEQVARLESHIIKAVQPYQEELQFLRNITTLGEKEVALVVAELGPELLGIVDLEALSDAIDQVLGYRRRN
jgi:transposase